MVTEEQIVEWKAKHGEIWLVEVAEDSIDFESSMVSTTLEDGQATAKGYLRKPNTKEQSFAYAKMQDSSVACGEFLLKQCWLGGDERLKDHPSFRLAAAGQAVALAEFRVARIKKL